MSSFDVTFYAPALAELLRPPRLAPLGPGKPDAALRGRLQALADDTAFAPHPVRDRSMADACRAGLWLYHDFLDESHAISQELHSAEGSYWHAVLHRREPDYSNSKYWFRRVGSHAVFEPLREEAARLAGDAPGPAAFLGRQGSWDPFAFVDLCEASSAERAACHELCRQVQRVEWELLFDWCYRRATVTSS
jgi:hypothetical protein